MSDLPDSLSAALVGYARRWSPVLLLLLAVVFYWTGQRAEREYGAVLVQLDSSKAREAVKQATIDSLATVYRVDTVTLWRQVRRLDTLTVTVDQWKHDTVRVVEYVTRADSTVRACTAALQTCEQRVAAERALTDEVRTQLALTRRIAGRPWTSAGVAWDPHANRFGGYLDRDWSRFRVGVSVTPAEHGIRAGLRFGVRW